MRRVFVRDVIVVSSLFGIGALAGIWLAAICSYRSSTEVRFRVTEASEPTTTHAKQLKNNDAWQEQFALARAWLSAGSGRRALSIFEDSWRRRRHANWSRGRLALYIALCHEQNGDRGEANRWFDRAVALGLPEFKEGLSDFVASAGIRSAVAHDSEVQFVAFVSDDRVAKLQEAVERLRVANAELDETKLETRVRLATWLLLVGELTSNWEDLSLSSNSLEALGRGKELLARVSANLDGDPQLQQQLERDPELAIRYDTAIVRLNVLNQRETAAWERERARLNQLRSIARSYRTTVESLGNSELNLLLGDYDQLRESREKALKELASVETTCLARKDAYLFADEPNLLEGTDFEILRIQPRPFSESVISFHKSLLAFSLLHAAEQANDNRRELLNQARKWAAAALADEQPIAGVPAGADSKNTLASYVQAVASDSLGLLAAADADPELRGKAQAEFEQAREETARLGAILAEWQQAVTPAQSRLRLLVTALSDKNWYSMKKALPSRCLC